MKLRTLLLSLLLAPLGYAQQAVVTGTITDPYSVPYYPATISACLEPVTVDPVVGGIHVNPNQGANYCLQSTTGGTGYFTLYLYPNAIINNGTTQWRFTVTASGSAPPAGRGPQTFVSDITIAGTAQDVSAALSAASVSLLNSGISSMNFGSNVVVANVLPGGNLLQGVCTWVNGTRVIGCTGAVWDSTMVGYLVRAATASLGNAFPVGTTVTAVTSATTAIVSANATYSAAGSGSLGLFPRDETSTINSAIAKAIASTNCGTVVIPRGTYLTTSAFSALANLPDSCYNWGNGSSPGLQVVGFPVSIQGKATSIVMPSDFDWTSCNLSNICFNGNSGANVIRCIGFGFMGLGLLPASAQNKTVASCGGNDFGVHSLGNSTITGFQSFALPGAGAKCLNCVFDGTGPVNWGGYFGSFSGYMEGGVYVIVGSGGNLQIDSDGTEIDGILFQTNGGKVFCSQGARIGSSVPGVSTSVRSVATVADLFIDGCHIFGNATNAFTASPGANLNVHATHMYMTGAGYTNLLNGAVTFYDDCGNTFSGGLGAWTSSAGWFGSCSSTGTVQTSGNWSTPAGSGAGQWGTSPSTSACSGNSLVQVCTITVGSSTVGANPVLTITHPTPFQVAPLCDARMIGGTAAFANFTTGAVSTTTAAFTYNGTPAASSTVILKVSCSN